MTGVAGGARDGVRDAAIRLEAVTKVFPGSAGAAVRELSLDMAQGSLTALVGPSGCGKTTTLKMVNRLIEPTSGTIVVDGRDVRERPVHELRRDIGYVIQQVGLFPHQTVATNIGTVPRLLGWDKERVRARVAELVGLIGLEEGLLARYPAELSGGQQQRVGVARALAADPPVLLMDEPYSAVDPIVRAHLQDELLRLQEQVQKTIVLVTHDIDEAIKLADRIAILNVGGVLEQYGTPEELLRRPANEFVERFLGHERGLKRMALLKVADVPLSPGAVVPVDATPQAAKEVMARFGVDWVGVLDGDRLRGWVPAGALDRVAAVGDAPVERFVSWVTPQAALRQALDTIVTSHTRAAVVLDGDRYLGMVFLDQIAEGVA
ncbi:MAG: ATP-binding cassette protein [Acidimicrobiales bacterium]|nr:ATP-binding cassette protein [Acidimicrobiales bacterium]